MVTIFRHCFVTAVSARHNDFGRSDGSSSFLAAERNDLLGTSHFALQRPGPVWCNRSILLGHFRSPASRVVRHLPRRYALFVSNVNECSAPKCRCLPLPTQILVHGQHKNSLPVCMPRDGGCAADHIDATPAHMSLFQGMILMCARATGAGRRSARNSQLKWLSRDGEDAVSNNRWVADHHGSDFRDGNADQRRYFWPLAYPPYAWCRGRTAAHRFRLHSSGSL